MSIRFLIINADYPDFLRWLYAQHPRLEQQPYEEQMRVRMDSLFGVADFYSSNLCKLGHEAYDIYANNEFAQKAWARGSGLEVEEGSKLSQQYKNILRQGAGIAAKTPLRYLRPIFRPGFALAEFARKVGGYGSRHQLLLQWGKMSIKGNKFLKLPLTVKRYLKSKWLHYHPGGMARVQVLRKYLNMVLSEFPEPTLIETGCIRTPNNKAGSTLTISKLLSQFDPKGCGRFYTFDINPEHIAICKDVCRDYNDYITYVEGDSVENLRMLVGDKTTDVIHFAFLDSANEGDQIWREFRTIEALFPKKSIVIVDDVLRGAKGEIIKPYLENSAEWQTIIFNVDNGMLVAIKR